MYISLSLEREREREREREYLHTYIHTYFDTHGGCVSVGSQARWPSQVHIYRLISEATVEENILRKANQKRLLDSVVIQVTFEIDIDIGR